jgi:hypothetical protein
MRIAHNVTGGYGFPGRGIVRLARTWGTLTSLRWCDRRIGGGGFVGWTGNCCGPAKYEDQHQAVLAGPSTPCQRGGRFRTVGSRLRLSSWVWFGSWVIDRAV